MAGLKTKTAMPCCSAAHRHCVKVDYHTRLLLMVNMEGDDVSDTVRRGLLEPLTW